MCAEHFAQADHKRGNVVVVVCFSVCVYVVVVV